MAFDAGKFPSLVPGAWAPPLPPPVLPQVPAEPVLAPPVEAFTPSPVTVATPGPAVVQTNKVLLERHMEGGKQVGIKAVLPAIAGGGAFLPLAVAFESGQNGNHAYLSDGQGGKLLNGQGQAQELPVFQIDNRFLIATDKNLSPTSPYILVEQDPSTGQVAYGLTEGLGYNQNLDSGYTLRRSELIEPDGTRTMRFNEEYGAKGAPQMQMGARMLDMMTTGGMATMANLYDQGTGKTGRPTSFQEVHINADGQAAGNDVKYKYLATTERATAPKDNGLTAQLAQGWSQLKGQGSREVFPRTVQTIQDGSLQLDPDATQPSGLSMRSLKGMFTTETPRQTIVVTPLNTQYGPNRPGQEQLRNLLTSGQDFQG